MCANIAEGVTIGIKVLGVTDSRRIDRSEHAIAILELQTPLGTIRIRDIKIVWGEKNSQFFLRWRQWRTGRMVPDRRPGFPARPEYLDVASPGNYETRRRVESAILAVFHQIQEEAACGTLGRETVARLGELKASLEHEQAISTASDDLPATDDSNVGGEKEKEEEETGALDLEIDAAIEAT
jgi:DNA-binding cell septation regulator SpoVG